MHNTPSSPNPRPTLSRFSSRRGRPPSPIRDTDYGTPELIMKRALHETAEPLDICHERSLISDVQHRAGLHLRWLYTLRYGAPGISALDLTYVGGHTASDADSSAWRAEREAEYEAACQLLKHKGSFGLISGVCIHNERPRWLCLPELQRAYRTPNLLASFEREMQQLRDGLDALDTLWRRTTTARK